MGGTQHTMTALTVSLIVSACVLAGGLLGLSLHRVLPEAHLTKETQDVVKLGTGMLSVLASLVLGLLIATTKSAFDTTDHEIRSYAADMILLDETLRDYGQAAMPVRDALGRYARVLLRDTWPEKGKDLPFVREDRPAGELLERVRDLIRGLAPADGGQRWLQDQALQTSTALLRQRWLLIEQAGPSVRPFVLVILTSSIVLIFASFGLNAPRNATVAAAFVLCSLAIGGAIFLVLEMDTPFAGLMKISSQPITSVVAHMPPA